VVVLIVVGIDPEFPSIRYFERSSSNSNMVTVLRREPRHKGVLRRVVVVGEGADTG
jgi:hypothetical protein